MLHQVGLFLILVELIVFSSFQIPNIDTIVLWEASIEMYKTRDEESLVVLIFFLYIYYYAFDLINGPLYIHLLPNQWRHSSKYHSILHSAHQDLIAHFGIRLNLLSLQY